MRLLHCNLWLAAGLAATVACGGAGSPVAVPSARPQAASVAASASGPALGSADIDRAVEGLWSAAGVAPAAPAGDAQWLRRVTLDLTGTIPEPTVVIAFLASTSPGKRADAVARLLNSEAYARHWMNYWDHVLMGQSVSNATLVDRTAFRNWVYAAFRKNTRWNQFAFELLSASGSNSTGGPRMREGLSMPSLELQQAPQAASAEINGAVNFTLKYLDAPQDYAGTTSRVFLGVQIQCAQCHDHKSEAWKQTDFRSFAAAALHSKVELEDASADKKLIRRAQLLDAPRVSARTGKGAEGAPIAKAPPRALDGTQLQQGIGTRRAFASWMTAPANPWFAKAFVNRMWGHLMGRGFVDPVDDIRPSNTAVAEELWNALAKDFAEHGYDVPRLLQQITLTRAYALGPNRGSAKDEIRGWSRYRMVPLGPSELLSALFAATNLESAASAAGIRDLEPLRMQLVRNFSTLFQVDEEFDSESFEGSISQALTLMNGTLANTGARAIPGSALSDILSANSRDEDCIRAVYFKVLSRPAEPAELGRWTAFVQAAAKDAPATTVAGEASKKRGKGAKADPLARLAVGQKASTLDPRRAAYEDLMWTLLNSSEFIFNH